MKDYQSFVRSLSKFIRDGKRSTWTKDAPSGTNPKEFARAMSTLIATGLSDLQLPVHELVREGDEILHTEFHKELSTQVGYVVVACLNMCDLATEMQFGQRVSHFPFPSTRWLPRETEAMKHETDMIVPGRQPASRWIGSFAAGPNADGGSHDVWHQASH
jgi:hypothetical protein